MTLLHRESLERLSQQERCIAGLEARLAEAKTAKNHEAKIGGQEAKIAHQDNTAKHQEDTIANNIVNLEAITTDFEAGKAKEKEVEEPLMVEVGGRSRRGSSSSREFREDEEEDLEDIESKARGRRGSSSSREFQHEVGSFLV